MGARIDYVKIVTIQEHAMWFSQPLDYWRDAAINVYDPAFAGFGDIARTVGGSGDAGWPRESARRDFHLGAGNYQNSPFATFSNDYGAIGGYGDAV